MTMLHQMTILRSISSIQSTLSPFHPLLIEGHSRDSRDPTTVGKQLVKNIKSSWKERNITKPPILITQGDPLTETGISAITRIVANELDIKRCLVCLDDHIDPEHSVLADRHDVIYELRYSQLVDILDGGDQCTNDTELTTSKQLTEAIENRIAMMNEKRATLGKEKLAEWYIKYALLQEITKSAFKSISGEVTVAHSVDEINEFSVTSFYEIGLELGLIDDNNDMVYYTENTGIN